jgi:hypothetical protein
MVGVGGRRQEQEQEQEADGRRQMAVQLSTLRESFGMSNHAAQHSTDLFINGF